MLSAKELGFCRDVFFYFRRLHISLMKLYEGSLMVKSEDFLSFGGFPLPLGLKLKLCFDFQAMLQHGPTYLFSLDSHCSPPQPCSNPKSLLSFFGYLVLSLSVFVHFSLHYNTMYPSKSSLCFTSPVKFSLAVGNSLWIVEQRLLCCHVYLFCFLVSQPVYGILMK